MRDMRWGYNWNRHVLLIYLIVFVIGPHWSTRLDPTFGWPFGSRESTNQHQQEAKFYVDIKLSCRWYFQCCVNLGRMHHAFLVPILLWQIVCDMWLQWWKHSRKGQLTTNRHAMLLKDNITVVLTSTYSIRFDSNNISIWSTIRQ